MTAKELAEIVPVTMAAAIAQAERRGAESALREAADDFEVTAALGGSVIARLRARADEIAAEVPMADLRDPLGGAS